MTTVMTDDIRNNVARHRFELDVDGHTAIAVYRLSPGRITFIHTEVPPELRGCGVASRLVRGVLEAMRAQRLKVSATCSFVTQYIENHPEFADLRG